MQLSILIPYKPDGGHRDRLFSWVMDRYHTHFPEAQICIGENWDEPYNRSRARNSAFMAATGDTLLIADADTICDYYLLHQAFDLLDQNPRSWVLPYDTRGYYNLTQSYTEQVLSLPSTSSLSPRNELVFDHELESWAGLVIIKREAFEVVGGYDERFMGYGYEDNSFSMALSTIWGPLVRGPGYCMHLWHDRPNGDSFAHPFLSHNQELHQRYKFIDGHPDAMRAFIGARPQRFQAKG